MSQRDVREAGGPSTAKVREVENCRTQVMSPRTRRDLERALGWRAGSIDHVLAGDSPQVVPARRPVVPSQTGRQSSMTLDGLIGAYDEWKQVADRDTDEFGALERLVALYRFAIANFNEPGRELMLAAIEATETAEEVRK